ncbi:MAG: signal recognition particle receptor subunit alpha, partial [Cyanobacteria bacterium NC_groundwater_1444_Ag_S-0.65um_54_12]|nr:signal recognition particle receptor subunit alpha [Cyanobacteria bacterium NC_groundwater_1444_Ag_S-0.65um_54_12]
MTEQSPEGDRKKSFWQRSWEILNAPIPGTPNFGMDRAFLGQLTDRLQATRQVLFDKVKNLVKGRSKLDEELLEELEELLLESDMGVEVTQKAIAHLRQQAKHAGLSPDDITTTLADHLKKCLGPPSWLQFEPGQGLQVIILVGVNGTGKTTTIGKLAWRYTAAGCKVIIAAADTFRAAAIDQIAVWADRAGVQLIRHKEGG